MLPSPQKCDLEAEPMSSDSNTPMPTANLIISSQESCNSAGIKDPEVLIPAEKCSKDVVCLLDGPDKQSTLVKPCVEKIQHRIAPLLGQPYFTCIICKSHVHPPYQVVVPRAFASYLPSETARATLNRQNRTWEMRFTGGRLVQRLEAGWKSFALDNNLKIGDGCVFELIDSENLVFRVQVLHGDISPRIRDRAGGYTSSCPIVID